MLAKATVPSMWKKLKHIVHDIQAYSDLSPDWALRHRVNQSLQDRSALTLPAWAKTFMDIYQVSYETTSFVYRRFPDYSGIDFSRVRPGDRMTEDLQFPLVCWFDWEQQLCEDFEAEFGADLLDQLDEISLALTIDDLIVMLDQNYSWVP